MNEIKKFVFFFLALLISGLLVGVVDGHSMIDGILVLFLPCVLSAYACTKVVKEE